MLVQPDRQLRARRSARRLRAHRPQDHRRHLRRHGPPRWRRVQRQGPDEGRPLGRVRGAPRRQERRGRRAREAVRGAGRVRDRRRAPGLDHGRDVRHVGDRPATSCRTLVQRASSTCARPRSSSGSTCAGRSTSTPRRTGTSVAPTATSRGSAPTHADELRKAARSARLTRTEPSPGPRVCRVQPDVPAVDRAFDYLVPDALAARVARRHDRARPAARAAGARLGGRRRRRRRREVDAGRRSATCSRSCRPARRPTSSSCAGGRRGAGPDRSRTFLRAASPPNVVAPADRCRRARGRRCTRAVARAGAPRGGRRAARGRHPGGRRAGPAAAASPPEGSTIVLDPVACADVGARLAAALRDDGRDVVVLSSDRAAPRERTRAWARAPRGRVRRRRRADRGVGAGARPRGGRSSSTTATRRCRRSGRRRGTRATCAIERAAPRRRDGARGHAGADGRGARSRSASRRRARSRRGGWPRVEVVDLRDEEPGHGAAHARARRRAAPGASTRGERAVCVLNRRGRARLLACRDVSASSRAASGAAPTVRERRRAGSRARVCGTPRPLVCLHCHGTRFRAVRPGRRARARRPRRAAAAQPTVDEVDAATDGVPDARRCVVGTEAVLHRVAPGATRPVRLVAFLDLDQELLAPRDRAAEQALWLLVRGARLLGAGGDRRPLLLVQTRAARARGRRARSRRGDPMARRRRRARPAPRRSGSRRSAGSPSSAATRTRSTAACDALRGRRRGDGARPGRRRHARAGARAATWRRRSATRSRAPGVDAAHALGPAPGRRRPPPRLSTVTRADGAAA